MYKKKRNRCNVESSFASVYRRGDHMGSESGPLLFCASWRPVPGSGVDLAPHPPPAAHRTRALARRAPLARTGGTSSSRVAQVPQVALFAPSASSRARALRAFPAGTGGHTRTPTTSMRITHTEEGGSSRGQLVPVPVPRSRGTGNTDDEEVGHRCHHQPHQCSGGLV